MARHKKETDAKRYLTRRRNALRQARKQAPVDALLITDYFDIRYLSGVTEGAGTLLITKDAAVVVTSAMFADRLPGECSGCEVVVKGDFDPDDLETRRIVRGRSLKKVGYQQDLIGLARYRTLCEHVGPSKLVPLCNVVRDLRAVKDDVELGLIRKAVRIAERAFGELIEQGAGYLVGKTEKELAAELEYRMRMCGADRQGFPFNGIIVGVGPNSASAHHFPTGRRVRDGDVVLFDWGAEVDGYRSDITRVIFVGDVNPRLAEIYEVVRAAHAAAIAAIRPGIRTRTVDKVARDLITEAGYGELFRHGLGHGFGLQIHEHPFLRRTDVPLKKNMVVTVEPGIYLKGIGGVRLENDILVTSDGRRDLNRLPTRLEEMIVP